MRAIRTIWDSWKWTPADRQGRPLDPLRGELLTPDELERRARGLAADQAVEVRPGSNRLLGRLHSNERVLRAFNRSSLDAQQNRVLTPAAEWLLDNFYLIEEQISMARRHLPRSYSRELPRLRNLPSAGLPRVYWLMLEFLTHVDAQLDADPLCRFVEAFQEAEALTLGELWAVPIMLRLGLIENLRRIAVRLSCAREERDLADEWAGRLGKILETDPSGLLLGVADMARSGPALTSAFVARFCQRLSAMDPAVHFARNWIEQRLTQEGQSIEQLTLLESRRQAEDQVSVSHTIGSLRFLGSHDWRKFVERVSRVELALRSDPAGVYPRMDFATRDRYRHEVEEIARYCGSTELEVALIALEVAVDALRTADAGDRTTHVGHILASGGRAAFEEVMGVKLPWRRRLERSIRAYPLAYYGGGIFATVALSLALVVTAAWDDTVGLPQVFALALLIALCSSQLAVTLMNWLAMILVKPQLLPRMDYEKGIPEDCRTMVVVPTLLSGLEAVDRLLETLEIHYLGNREAGLHFALLTDFSDAPTEHLSTDDELLSRAVEGVEGLNRRYAGGGSGLFYLFHRPRRWNAGEGAWMGHERKRGKLAEFNEVLRGRGEDRFSRIVGDRSLLPQVRYVITLDTDTQLPRDAARRLIGTISHPLNRPRFDPVTGIVAEGYGILQPRVGVSLPSAARSWFVRLFAGDAGIDPYTRVVSDVYQDLFGEGSFIGKGIYDVDAFERATRGRFPENTVLSHDLIESVHARSALVSDVEFYEEHPSRYNADINRRHRWIRGDWQIAQWLLPRVPGPDARWILNPLSGVSQWKIFDNLRRSLVPLGLLLLIVVDGALVPALRGAGTVLAIGIILLPALLSVMGEAVHKPVEWPLMLHLHSILRSLGHQAGQCALTLLFLPYDAWISVDAVVRTLIRLLITRRKLLEWQTAMDAERNASTSLPGFFATMWIAPAAGVGTLAWMGFDGEELASLRGVIAVGWMFAPWVAWWISLPIRSRPTGLSAGQEAFLRRTARQTWRFFESFVGGRENWLPPDNFQVDPAGVVAARTSPTNIGLLLLSNLAARDFCYISQAQLIDLTQKTLGTLDRLERHRGHFYNWYDTRTLAPLLPRYVSTVDSGNLAGCLLTLAGGLVEGAGDRLVSPRLLDGLRDTFGLLSRAVGPRASMRRIAELLEGSVNSPREALGVLESLLKAAVLLDEEIATGQEAARHWRAEFQAECQAHLDDLNLLAPWLRTTAERLPLDPGGRVLEDNLTLAQVAQLPQTLASWFERQGREGGADRVQLGTAEWIARLGRVVEEAAGRAAQRLELLRSLALRSEAFAVMDFTFLFDSKRNLFVTGYNAGDHRLDTSHYDLLASEARLTSFIAVAQGQVGQDHWFSLGRLLTAPADEPVLVSWSGSMFEYLMPLLLMPTYEGTLLDQSCHAAVRAQIRYGKSRGVPWGISESGYQITDAELNYQYRAFGVPGLGLRRGLGEDLVLAPYASVLALMVSPAEAEINLEQLAEEGCLGDYGFYEALDYTPSRLPPGQTRSVVRSFMAHHQGMSLLSFAYLLLNRPMQHRFLANPTLKAAELLLQERIPRTLTHTGSEEGSVEPRVSGSEGEAEGAMRIFNNPNLARPEVHLLSNGRYHVAISTAGGGYSRWQDLALTRWREDGTRDSCGSFCYLRDVKSGEVFSASYQPSMVLSPQYEAIFTQARAEFRQRHGDWEVHAEISVSPEEDVELRRLSFINHSNLPRAIEITTCMEVVLAPQSTEVSHPAFSNLFVQTEYVQGAQSLLCTRRPRSDRERTPWLVHVLACHGTLVGDGSHETDRSRFLGRGRDFQSPAAMDGSGPLSNTTGSVLDPMVSLRRTLLVPAESTACVDIVLGVAESREAAVKLAEKYRAPRMSDRLLDLAWTHSQVTLRNLGATGQDALAYGSLASSMIYADSTRRAPLATLLNNRRALNGLWSQGISGDLPILLVHITDGSRLELVRQVIQAHAYWRLKGLAVDLVILNEESSVYRQSLHEQIVKVIESGIEAQMLEKPGGIFVRRVEQLAAEDRMVLQVAARVLLSDENGSLREQSVRRAAFEAEMARLIPSRSPGRQPPVALPPRDLVFFNGLGGFTPDGKEYILRLSGAQRPAESDLMKAPHANGSANRDLRSILTSSGRKLLSSAGHELRENLPFLFGSPDEAGGGDPVPGAASPAPWVNVVANPFFGTVVSEAGSAYTWIENSHELRLTPWNNDPVTDSCGEALYLRDEETGEFWSPTPLPARGEGEYVVRHGFGYTVFEHAEAGLVTELTVYVAMDAPVKFLSVVVRNLSGRARRLSLTGYWEWVLGDLRHKTAMHVRTEVDPMTGALLAHNPFNPDFGNRVAFADVNDTSRTVTGDRREFLGSNGRMATPAAMRRVCLSGRTGPGLDPCAALQVAFEIEDGQTREIVFRMGAGRSLEEVRYLIQRFRRSGSGHGALERVWEHWNRTLGAVQVETPEPAVNLLANGWLLYQTLACRLWARTGFYQSGGAFGFRDQLQDAMAMVHAEPSILREQLLRAAARQFREGDVQHWWHPPGGRGVRTRFGDDFLWLPYAACRYVSALRDTGVLDEQVPFLEGRPLKPEEESYYDLAQRSLETATLYEHCVRAIRLGLRFGRHGLPLMGCGDWNDGMNLVGAKGEGESVWLGFFMFDVLTQFAGIARERGDEAFAGLCLETSRQLRSNLELNAWDGEWYLRAFFDNGDPLGSRSNEECRIDSLPQSWAVLSGAGDAQRSRTAMDAVIRHLVRKDAGLIQLFDPPFDKSSLNPGYIKGYVPGVRENGGQYTHAALWAVMALARLGENEEAWRLFELLNPVNHSSTPDGVSRYRVEPYVVAADVYGVAPHAGRGGWTWYTGSAGWMYRLLVESLLGVIREGDTLRFEPRIPRRWDELKIRYRYHDTFYQIAVRQNPGEGGRTATSTLDGVPFQGAVGLTNDRQPHLIQITLGPAEGAGADSLSESAPAVLDANCIR